MHEDGHVHVHAIITRNANEINEILSMCQIYALIFLRYIVHAFVSPRDLPLGTSWGGVPETGLGACGIHYPYHQLPVVF